MSEHVEFPELTPEARECLAVAFKVAFPWHDEGCKEDWIETGRKAQAAFLREAMKQAFLCDPRPLPFIPFTGQLGFFDVPGVQP
jgi:hypothetical protein